jgi:hypothetical protein
MDYMHVGHDGQFWMSVWLVDQGRKAQVIFGSGTRFMRVS